MMVPSFYRRLCIARAGLLRVLHYSMGYCTDAQEAATIVGVAALICIGSVGCGNQRTTWKRVATDLETKTASLPGLPFLQSEVFLLRTSLEKYRLGVIRADDFAIARSDVKSLVTESKAVAGINANFFDEHGKPLGVVITKGVMRQRMHKGGNLLTGILEVRHDLVRIVGRDTFTADAVVEAVQAGPRLVIDKNRVENIADTSPSRRAGVCVDDRGRLVMFCVSSTLFGVSIQELQALLTEKEIGCVDALNLDGGGSAQFYLNPENGVFPIEEQEVYLQGGDQVPVALGLFVKRELP